MNKWKDKSTFQKILMIFVWLMIIATILSVVAGSAAAFFGGA
ncbi:DUF4044 domain-containing protein [Fructilactobacillus fructivorans]|uniref:DUF4044 domain-containing protein n=1 Tax=Fructilactobacillus fructivorans TaxID=1614 RepID=A0A0C1PN16_9LACO|nr:DUF4044 domain-containing protein [Fructilactobacillus fructivorans]KID41311.1 hypothetical protein LfDm3_1156 [Fructilactobacillus fructivorans]MCT0152085.1 DUF4044 domain-containing protein [Fructilactobacillus fructivorans]MCT2867832.1 DUF4044 domain-containing protein [Fructilactobacillus fructivorans]MCT2868364.1 DUF4044 domain-containing protein [Fructilactobacillus fructivorans]MCT2873873.1 DUF4044 domain-containing protein [Fructilactobacillus fructivorans]